MSTETIREPRDETKAKITEIWERELAELDVPVDESAIWVSSVLIEGVEDDYGPDSDLPLPYHGPVHSLDVIRRSLVIWREEHKQLPRRFPLHDLGKVVVQGAGHDRRHHLPEKNDELRSSEDTQDIMRAAPQPYSEHDCQRVGRAILTTVATLNTEGYVEQINLRHGEKDPLKLTLAYADINGIAMEGTERMLRDATSLFMEYHGFTKPYQLIGNFDMLVDFLGGQAKFLQSRLQAIPGDVAYYFPDSEEAVRAALVLTELFKPHDIAMRAAELMRDSGMIRTILRGASISSLDDIGSFAKEVFTQLTDCLPGKSASAAT